MCCREVYESISDAKTHDRVDVRNALHYKEKVQAYLLFCSF